MTGLCDTCGSATVLEHMGRHRLPVEFCPHCAVVVGQLDQQRAATMRSRTGETGDLCDREFFTESLAIAREQLASAAARSLTSRRPGANVSDGERPVTPDQPSKAQP